MCQFNPPISRAHNILKLSLDEAFQVEITYFYFAPAGNLATRAL